jgi:hypothetical protein
MQNGMARNLTEILQGIMGLINGPSQGGRNIHSQSFHRPDYTLKRRVKRRVKNTGGSAGISPLYNYLTGS